MIKAEDERTHQYIQQRPKVRQQRPSVHPKTLYGICPGVSFPVLKPSAALGRNHSDRRSRRRKWFVHALEKMKFFLKPTKHAHSDALVIGFDSANDRIKNAFFHFVETVLANLVLMRKLNDILQRRSEKKSQFSLFVNAFPDNAFTPSHFPLIFARTVANIISGRVGEQSGKNEGTKKTV